MMDTDRYQRAKAIFFEACERPRDDRAAYVQDQCADDVPLCAAVMELLLHDDDPLTLMNSAALREHLERLADEGSPLPSGEGLGARAASDGIADRARPHPDPLPRGEGESCAPLPERIGRYRILKILGEGGMGVVYLAEQENPRRQVALKVIARGQTSRQMLRRFEHEAQILGRLHHPGIAQIYEAGMHDAGDGGRPYFAMELVRGRPLIEFSNKNKVDRRGRLELFIAICEAVQHAHQQGVVHRDLKPANILVQEVSGGDRCQVSGTARVQTPDTCNLTPVTYPKILDFGVARLTDSDVQATTMHTAADQIIGTVAYMSPEQLAGRPDDIDTRSDVYALGVILFELLSGRLPHDVANKTMPETIRIVGQEEPTTLSSIDRAYRGDLDTIVRKTLERDKSRRYQSAGELAADVRRYLRDEPIHARPPSTIYQFRKFARRNKALVGGAAAVFLALVAGIVATTWQARQAMAHAGRAEAEAEKALSVSDFLQRMLSSARPAVTQGRELSVREVLDEAAAELDRTGGDLAPEVEGALRVTVARAYLALERHEAAQPHLDRALVRLREAYGEEHETIADCLEATGRAARERGDWKGAERITREALDMINRLEPGDHELKALLLASLGWILPRDGRLQEAEESCAEALAMLTRLRGPDDLNVAGLKIDLASISHGNPVHNEQLVIEAIDDITQQLGDRDPTLPRALNLLGAYQQIGGRLEEAEASYQRAFEIRLTVHGPDASTVIDNAQLVAWAAAARGECPRALALLKEYLPHARTAFRGDELLLVSYLARLASYQQTCGEHRAAAELLRESIMLFDRSGSPPTPVLAKALSSLALLLAVQGEDDEALRLAQRYVALPEDAAPAGHATRGEALLALGEVQTRRGDFAAAEAALLKSESIFESSGPRYQPHRTRAIKSIIALYEEWSKREPGAHAEEIERWGAAGTSE